MYKATKISGFSGGECSLIAGEHSALLVDSGFGFCADEMLRQLEQALAGRALEAVLLTHSHYDHAAGSAAVKRRFPGARVVASEQAKQIFTKPGARALMRELDSDVATRAGLAPAPQSLFDALEVDIPAHDGQLLEFAEFTVQAVATPGHTRCSMSYFLPEDSLLIASETVGGAPFFPQVVPCFITSYRDTVDALARSVAFGAKRVIPAHGQVLSGTDVAMFWDIARTQNEAAAELVLRLHEQGKSEEEIVAAFRYAFYTGKYPSLQPETAFLINTRAMVPRLLSEYGKINVA